MRNHTPPSWFLVLVSTASVILVFLAASQALSQAGGEKEVDPTAKIQRLEHEQELLRRNFEVEIANLKHETTKQAFSQLEKLAMIAGGLGAICVVLTWFREQREHRDNEKQRQFFQNEATANRARDDKLFASEIDNIEKIGSVIDLVKKSYEIQNEREKKLKEQHDEFNEFVGEIKKLSTWYGTRFREVCSTILTFKDYSRMSWTHLSDPEVKTLESARIAFRGIPDFVIDEERARDPGMLARVSQLIGVSAYYSNDVLHAEKYLKLSYEIYEQIKAVRNIDADDVYPYAFTCHFLAIIDKNWKHKDRPSDANFTEAAALLEKAAQLLINKHGEVLTPLTLAEVRSYLDSQHDAAAEKASALIQGLQNEEELDDNQSALLGRAYLIRGNLDFVANRYKEAHEWYGEAHEHDKTNAYACLSLAQVSKIGAKQMFEEGLTLLEEGSYLGKREDAVRLTAIAWAALASAAIGDEQRRNKYMNRLVTEGTNMRLVADRQPLVFCPVTKKPVLIAELQRNIAEEAKKYEKKEKEEGVR